MAEKVILINMILGVLKASIRVAHRILAEHAFFDFILGLQEIWSMSNEKYLRQIFAMSLTKTQISPFTNTKTLSVLTKR